MILLKKILIILLVVLLSFNLFGCTLSVNPLDLSPTKKYFQVDSKLNNGQNTTDYNSLIKITLTIEEVTKHSKGGDCWMIINGAVYDLSEYVNHPGGYGYLKYCGKEATKPYTTLDGRGRSHSNYAELLLSNYLIGKFGQQITINDTNSLTAIKNLNNPLGYERNNNGSSVTDSDEDYYDD